MSALSEQLSKVRADAAECALVASLTSKQMYERIADHLTALANEVAQAAKEGVRAA
jgi:hypothetical protein